MKKSRFSEQQIAFILKQGDDGTSVEEVCRLKQLEEENARQKRRMLSVVALTAIVSGCQTIDFGLAPAARDSAPESGVLELVIQPREVTVLVREGEKALKERDLDKAFSNSSLADVGEDESGTLWALSKIAPARVYRLKGTQEKTYYVINSTDTNTPRNMAVAADGTVYVAVGAQLYKMEAGKSVFKQIESSDIFYVHLGPGGDLWIINQDSDVQQYTGSKFENRPKGTAQEATDMAVGADGSVYALDPTTSLLKKWNAANGRFDDVNITQTMEKVTVTVEGRPWLANTSGGLVATGEVWRAKD